ncbi:MAG: hypothetical protein K2M41_09165 [Muribaculaceae bacterium]|nr:hypothetical protein [Muribaculaceae bacterium]
MDKKIIDRRSFFKKAAKAALPIVAAITIPSILTSCKIDEPYYDGGSSSGCSTCTGGCKGGCGGTCVSNCSAICGGSVCKGTCGGACSSSCGSTCRGLCTKSNKY